MMNPVIFTVLYLVAVSLLFFILAPLIPPICKRLLSLYFDYLDWIEENIDTDNP